MRRPIIGITMDVGAMQASGTYTGLTVHYAQAAFAEAVEAAGGIPYLIPLNAQAYLSEVIELIDGLILIGGSDVGPIHYQQQPREKLGPIKPERDLTDIALFKAAVAAQIPVLGVCRGMQLLNAVLGGTLHQDLSENPNISIQHDQKSAPNVVTHTIEVASESYWSRLVTDQSYVNSYHHQVIDQLAPSLKATVFSSDQVIEAVESEEEVPLILGVQWHPETLYQDVSDQLAIFQDLIQRANHYRQ